jgi:hypothetical protein
MAAKVGRPGHVEAFSPMACTIVVSPLAKAVWSMRAASPGLTSARRSRASLSARIRPLSELETPKARR